MFILHFLEGLNQVPEYYDGVHRGHSATPGYRNAGRIFEHRVAQLPSTASPQSIPAMPGRKHKLQV